MNWEKLKESFLEAFKYGIVAVIAGVIAGVINTGMNSNYPVALWSIYVIILMFFGIVGLTLIFYFLPNEVRERKIKKTISIGQVFGKNILFIC